MGSVIAFPSKSGDERPKVEVCLDSQLNVALDLLVAVDAAIRELRELEALCSTAPARLRAVTSRIALERALTAALGLASRR